MLKQQSNCNIWNYCQSAQHLCVNTLKGMGFFFFAVVHWKTLCSILTAAFFPGKLKKESGPVLCAMYLRTDKSFTAWRGLGKNTKTHKDHFRRQTMSMSKKANAVIRTRVTNYNSCMQPQITKSQYSFRSVCSKFTSQTHQTLTSRQLYSAAHWELCLHLLHKILIIVYKQYTHQICCSNPHFWYCR